MKLYKKLQFGGNFEKEAKHVNLNIDFFIYK